MVIKDLSLTKPLYRDQYIVEEDQMGNSTAQTLFIRYEISVLERLYQAEGWMIAGELNHYHNALDNSEKLIVPDIAVFKGIHIPQAEQAKIRSWNMRKGDKACPPLVIEASSESTYGGDIDSDKKPRLYGLIGVKEYFAYDPNPTPVWPREIGTRLLGWRYDAQGQPVSIKPNQDGRMWSEVLESWLESDGLYLRLYDAQGELRLTAEAAESLARQKAEEQTKTVELARQKAEKKAKTESLARQQAEKRATTEAQARKKAEDQTKTAEQRIAELERQLAESRRKND